MIQRIQSMWLFLAAIFAAFTYKLPFYSGLKKVKDVVQPVKLDASHDFIILILTAFIIILSLVTLFSYKDRKTQLPLAIVDLILSFVLIVLYFLQIQKFESGTISLWSLFSIAIPIFLFLAARGIWQDQKIIKSLDRIR
jgi:drug/metabolite transporter (DMT)-like permease